MVLENGKYESKTPADSVCGESSLCSLVVEGKRALWGLLYKGLIPFIRALPSRPNHLPEAPPPNTITLGVRFQQKNFGDTNHSVHNKVI